MPSSKLRRGLLLGRIDLTSLHPSSSEDLALIAAASIQCPSQGIPGARAAGVEVGIYLRLLERLGLGLLCRLGSELVALLAKLLESVASSLVLILGKLLDLFFLAIRQLQLFGHGIVAGQHDEIAARSSSPESAPASRPAGPARATSALSTTSAASLALAAAGRGLRLRVDCGGRQCQDQGRRHRDSNARHRVAPLVHRRAFPPSVEKARTPDY